MESGDAGNKPSWIEEAEENYLERNFGFLILIRCICIYIHYYVVIRLSISISYLLLEHGKRKKS
jgi:hypothetical protein